MYDDAMALRYALLGLLNDAPASGYELTQRFALGIDRYAWSAKHSQIYPELRKLEGEGLIEVVGEGARGKRSYGVTEAGRARLRDWLLSEPSAKGTRNEFVLRLFLMSALTNEEAVQLLTDLSKFAEAEQAELTAKVAELQARDDATLTAPVFAAQYGVHAYGAIREWANWVLTELAKKRD